MNQRNQDVAQKYDGSGRRAPGRPRTAAEVEALVVRIAEENGDWVFAGDTHLSLDKQCSHVRPVSSVGRIVKIPELGGLHHRYERIAA